MSSPALSVSKLSVVFSTDAGRVDAVRDVSFAVGPGEVLAIVGESGSGKSVSARTAMGLLPASARVRGVVEVAGRDVNGLSDKQFSAIRGADVAMVFQEPGTALDPLFTAGYQISEALRAPEDAQESRDGPRGGAAEPGGHARPGRPPALLPASALRWAEAARGHRHRHRV